MPSGSLTDRIERHIKIIGKEKGLSINQVNSIIQLVSTIRTDGAISDEDLHTFFELVGGE